MATYPLEITFPLPEGGAAGSGLASGHKVFSAYPGIPYHFYTAVGGAGQPPYKFRISNAPAGMAIDTYTGEVTWSNPIAGTYADILIEVIDAEHTTDSVEYTLTVTTTGYRFVDANAADETGDGTLADPWKTIEQVYANAGDTFVYFRSGTYTITDTSIIVGYGTGTIWEDRVRWQQSASKPTTMLGYPGETVIINFGSNHTLPTATGASTSAASYVTHDGGWAPFFSLEGDRVYVDNIRFTGSFNKALQTIGTNNRGMYLCRSWITGHGHEVPVSGANAAGHFFGNTQQTYSDVMCGNYYSDITYGTQVQNKPFIIYLSVKQYTAFNRLDQVVGSVTQGGSYKGGPTQWNDYMNYWNAGDHGIGGDMSPVDGGPPISGRGHGEFWFDHFIATSTGPLDSPLEMNQQGTAARVWASRCTFQGTPAFLNGGSGEGPFGIQDSVLINPGTANLGYARYTNGSSLVNFTASATPTAGQNLGGTTSAGYINSTTGYLIGDARTAYLGLMGHETVAADYGEFVAPPVAASGHPAFVLGVF